MFFKIKPLSASKNLIEVSFRFAASGSRSKINIPFWRPGRYEGGNFPRNYIGLTAQHQGQDIPIRKTTPHSWTVTTPVNEVIIIKYRLYAAELTAGNTYYDGGVLLINPVNALLYIPGRENENIEIELDLPSEWSCATSLQSLAPSVNGTGLRYLANNMQALMDSPLMAAADLMNYSYQSHNHTFHIHMSGLSIPESNGVINDFRAFTDAQIEAFGTFPVADYHFLLLFFPYQARHGVEHEQSTVIIMGPGTQLAQKEMYNSLLSISSHELYHTWNVKYIRPAEWTPYDFSGPEYSRLGYVAEGVTTYMGDWMLWQAGVFTDDEFLEALTMHWERHMRNQGRFNLSLADASIDTWTDGYGGGAPERRISIYDEGALLALVCDAWIVNASQGQSGLWTAMRTLYADCNPAVGYSEDDFWNVLENAASSAQWAALRSAVVDGKGALEYYVLNALSMIGLQSKHESPKKSIEEWWGAGLNIQGTEAIAIWIAPDSPAEACGLWYNNVVKTINGQAAATWINNATVSQIRNDTAYLSVRQGQHIRNLVLVPDGQPHCKSYVFEKDDNSNPSLFENWKKTLRINL
jgi:predicted metalloprotease with PDZ domain